MFDRKYRPITQHQFRTQFDVKSRSSELTISGDGVYIKCYIANDNSARNRRQFLLSLNNKITPFLDFVYWSDIHHDHHIDGFTGRDHLKELSRRQAIILKEEEGKIGYLIRGVRTKLGQTQVTFAKNIDMDPTYLSKIEKGHLFPSRKLLNRILEMKNAPEMIYP